MKAERVTLIASHGDPTFLNRRAWTTRWQDRAGSVAGAERVLELTASPGTSRWSAFRGLALRTLAWQAKWRGDFDDAMMFALRAEGCLSEMHHTAARVDLYSILGVIHYSRDRLDLASCATERGLLLAERLTDADVASRIDILTTKASIQRYRGQQSKAIVTLGTALDLASGADRGRVEQNVARTHLYEEDFDAARPHAEAAVDLCERYQNRVVLPYALEMLGVCQSAGGQHCTATATFARGLEVALADRDRRAQCQLFHRHGQLEIGRGCPKKALDCIRQGADIARRMQYTLWQKKFALEAATAYEAMGDFQSALAQHKLAWRLNGRMRS